MTVKTAAKGIRKGYVYDNKWKDRPYRSAWKSGGTQQITDDAPVSYTHLTLPTNSRV